MIKNLPASSGDAASIPGSGSPGEGEGNGNPLPSQYSYLGNPTDRGGLPSMELQSVRHNLVTKETAAAFKQIFEVQVIPRRGRSVISCPSRKARL